MSTMQTIIDWLGPVGGVAGLGVLVRAVYRSISKTHRKAVEADTTRDLVEIATSMLKPHAESIERLSELLAQEEARANRLATRIKELEAQAELREREMDQLQHQAQELKTQLLDAQLEVVRLRGMLTTE